MATYKVQTNTEVYIDDYDQGELDHVNSYGESYQVMAKSPKEAIELVITKYLYFDLGEGLNLDDTPSFSTLVDVDNAELSKGELAKWKRGSFKAYSNYTTFEVYELVKREVTE